MGERILITTMQALIGAATHRVRKQELVPVCFNWFIERGGFLSAIGSGDGCVGGTFGLSMRHGFDSSPYFLEGRALVPHFGKAPCFSWRCLSGIRRGPVALAGSSPQGRVRRRAPGPKK